MTSIAMAAPAGFFRKVTVRDAVLLVVMAGLIPFLVHLVPWSNPRPLGAYLLPLFWTTFIAVYFYGAVAGLLTGLLAPAVNLLVTGLPAWKFFGTMSLELVAFVAVTTWAMHRVPRLWLIAPLGYFIAKTISSLLLAPATVIDHPDAAGYFFSHLIIGGAAGLVVLALINGALVKFYPKTSVATDA